MNKVLSERCYVIHYRKNKTKEINPIDNLPFPSKTDQDILFFPLISWFHVPSQGLDKTPNMATIVYRTHAQLQRFGETLGVENGANTVHFNRIGQIWSVKHEQLRFASQTLSPTFLT